MREGKVIVVGNTVTIDSGLLRGIKGPLWGQADGRFFCIMAFSFLVHLGMVWTISRMQLSAPPVRTIEQIPERFARLIIDKPIVKETPRPIDTQAPHAAESAEQPEEAAKESAQQQTGAEARRQEAKQSVARRAQHVEEKIRNVGVLGLLTGTGATARGGSVVDVLGKIGDRRNAAGDLDKMLENMAGLQKAPGMDVLDKKLVGSKEVALDYREDIDDLLADMSKVTTKTIAKQGNVIINRPKSIEGAASSDALRQNEAINSIVSSHKVSMRMTYERYLKRDPGLEGKITVRFTIAASGAVTVVEILENTTSSKELENEIVRKIKMWRFEPVREGEVSVTFPFIFQSSSL
jgi:TonB family protein